MLADFPHSPTFAHKLKSSICCFHGSQQDDLLVLESPSKMSPRSSSPCSWLKSTAGEFPDLLDRCRYLLARMGRGRTKRYLGSLDFTYDSSSYALNFEDDCPDAADEFPFRDFNARLPPAVKERATTTKFVGSRDGITISACG